MSRAAFIVAGAAALSLVAGDLRAQGSGAPAGGEAEMPDLNADLTAYRIDSDVYGWNKKYTEMAAIGSEVRRGARGEHRGEAFLLVFDVGSVVPKHNVHVLAITQAALPHDPIPLEDVRGRMWGIDWTYQRKWPKRPKRKHFKGAMKIEPIWESVDLGEEICQPTVGFLLDYKGQRRYQPHQQLPDVRAPCAFLRMTDARTYWAKKDLGAVMMRFDYSATDNEVSLRFPLAASWKLAKSITLMLRAPNPKAHGAIKKQLSTYGNVRTEPGGDGSGWHVLYREGLIYLAHRIGGQIGARVLDEAPPAGIDILVTAANAAAPEIPRDAPTPVGTPTTPDLPNYGSTHDCAGLLRDCE